jgi:tetratricopeptide (TPR) repeat protein
MSPLIDSKGNIPYFGRLSWGNLVDWLITFGLGLFLVRIALALGGVRPETHLELLPLLAGLLVLHGIWLAVDDVAPKRISQIPLLFLPLLIWGAVSASWLSSTPWLGRIEWIYGLEAFLFFWIACNNVRTRAHVCTLLFMALGPLVVAMTDAVLQYYNHANSGWSGFTSYQVTVSPQFVGQSTGLFSDPVSFSVLLLLFLPGLLIAALVRRYSVIQRVLYAYLALMVIFCLILAQVAWALLLLIPIVLLLLRLFGSLSRQRFIQAVGIGVVGIVLIGVALFLRPQPAAGGDLLSQRLQLWLESGRMVLQHPIAGVGAGAFPVALQQSTQAVMSTRAEFPQNDFLFLLSQYGLVGALLGLVPLFYILKEGVKAWQLAPARKDLGSARERLGAILPFRKFILSVSLAGCCSWLLAAFFSFSLQVPALLLYGLLLVSILVKYSFNRRCYLADRLYARWSYLGLGVLLAGLLLSGAPDVLRAHALESEGRQALDEVIEQRLQLSSDPTYLDFVLNTFQQAVELDPSNADAWIGRSAATCQLYFRNPRQAEVFGATATEYAQRALDLSPGYSAAWGQLGVAHLLGGEIEAGEAALQRALELAPQSSQVHYLQAAFLSHFPERRDEARRMVKRALELNPKNVAAWRLSQRLLIL